MMRRPLIDLLRCPSCGGGFTTEPAGEGDLAHGVLFCACCAYPIVDGIPVLRLADEVSEAIRAVERGDAAAARRLVLDLPEDRHAIFDEVTGPAGTTFTDAVRRVLPDGEGDYYALRFGDPGFLAADAVVRTIGRRIPEASGPILDVGGGCGHLTWTLAQVARERHWPAPVLTDASFWRLSLARRFLVADADVVCADANQPLPFSTGAITLAVCNDVVHYVWSKRTLATDLLRVTGPRGWIAWTHVHSALGRNVTSGNTLAPAHYAALFGDRTVLACDERALVAAALAGRALPWTGPQAPALREADAIALVAAPHGGDLMLPAHAPAVEGGRVVRNPCYVETAEGDAVAWRLRLPSPEYEAEFGELRQYLPAELTWRAEELADLRRLAQQRPELIARRILLHVPIEYV